MPHPTTFSVVAYDQQTQEIGIAVASKFLAVGAVVPFVRAGAGAIATQAFANTSYGPRGLDMLAAGAGPQAVATALLADDAGRNDRQFGIVGTVAGVPGATYTGESCIEWAGGVAKPNFAAQGNCLTGPEVVAALAYTFERARGTLAERLLAALRAGDVAGGDKRGRQSAALVVEKPAGGYAGFNDRYVDLRVDDHANPVRELARLLALHRLYFLPAAPEDVLAIDASVGQAIVAELKRVGVLAPDHERYDDGARSALVSFMHVENLENRVRSDGTVDRQTLAYLRAHRR